MPHLSGIRIFFPCFPGGNLKFFIPVTLRARDNSIQKTYHGQKDKRACNLVIPFPSFSMDLVLRICDDYFLDNVWATLIPLSNFTSPELASNPPNITPNFAPIPVSSTWSQIVSHLPHSLRQNELVSLYTTAAKSHSLARVSAWPREYIPRQLISLCVITLVGIHVLYFLFAWLSYTFIFNHEMMKHPRFLKNQVKLEIQASLSSFPAMMLLTLPWFQAEVMGYSKVYDGLDTYGYFYLFASVPLCVFLSHFHIPIPQTDRFLSYLFFTDYCIYWVHRWLHLPIFYKHIHKPHHKWISALLYVLPFELRSPSLTPSSYAVCIACLPPFGWLHAIDTLSPLHLHFPHPSSRVPCPICSSQHVEYLCEHLLSHILDRTHVRILIHLPDP